MSRELTDIGYVRELLQRHGTRTKKGLGQNFIVNPSVCPRMAGLCGAKPDGGVLEVGCGVGVLTRELSRVAGKVVCVELDASLFPVLGETLEGCGNVELVQGDILKVDLDALIREKFEESVYNDFETFVESSGGERYTVDSCLYTLALEWLEEHNTPVTAEGNGVAADEH